MLEAVGPAIVGVVAFALIACMAGLLALAIVLIATELS